MAFFSGKRYELESEPSGDGSGSLPTTCYHRDLDVHITETQNKNLSGSQGSALHCDRYYTGGFILFSRNRRRPHQSGSVVFLFSMPTKTAAENSLYIIFFSQLASLLAGIVTGSIPTFPVAVLVWMVAGGIAGGILGRALNKRLEEKMVERCFVGIMVILILVNIYNIYKYM